MAEQDQRSVARFGDVDADAVGRDHSLGRLAHFFVSAPMLPRMRLIESASETTAAMPAAASRRGQ